MPVNGHYRKYALVVAWVVLLAIVFGCGGAKKIATPAASYATQTPTAKHATKTPTPEAAVEAAEEEAVEATEEETGEEEEVAEEAPAPTEEKEAPSSGGALTAKAAYAIALPLMQAWQKDAALTEVASSPAVSVKDGTCSDWHVKFFSPSARQTNSVYLANGTPQVMGALDMYESETYTPLDITTAAFDSDRVMQIAQDAGGKAYTDKGAAASVKYVGQEMYGGAVWIVNYTDTTVVIIIDPKSGNVLANVQ